MKKLFLLSLCCLLALGAAPALAADVVNVYNWGDYIDPDTLDLFTERTGIRVNYDLYETVEDMYTKIKRSNTSYDVIFPSDYMIERMIQEEMLLPIDFGNVPEYAQIDPRFQGQPFDPEDQYSVPYTWGTMGILYNTTLVEEAPTSWSALFDPQYAGNVLMLNARDSIGITLKYLGYSLNSTDPDEVEEAKALLIEQGREIVLAYVVDEVKDKMIGGEAALALVWAGDATYCMSENPDLNYVIPEEGSNLFFDSMCIPTSSQNKEAAEAFINFLCEPEIAAINYEYVGYAIPNLGAIELLGEEYLDSPVSNPPQELLDLCEVFRHGPQAQLYERVWTEIITSL